MTGTFVKQNGMFTNCDFVDHSPSLSSEIPTLGHIFRNNGYDAQYRGKWHLTHPGDRRFLDPLSDYGFGGWHRPDAPFGGAPYWGKLVDPLCTNQSLKWLADPHNHRRPWLLVSSLVDPHDICAWPGFYPQWLDKEIRTDAAPDNWQDDLVAKPRVQQAFLATYSNIAGPLNEKDPDLWRRYLDYYMYCTECADFQIGRILNALEASGQSHNTIVVFTSDHGDMGGSHRLRAKGNFAYDEVMNVPLIVSWPGTLPEGAVTDAMASNVDVMPTLCSLAGLKTSHYMPGKDLTRVLQNPGEPGPRTDVLFYTDAQGALRFGKTSIGDIPSHVRTIRNGQWKCSHYYVPKANAEEFELYDIKNDPLEMSNLAKDAGYRAQLKELHDQLMEQEMQLQKEAPDYCPGTRRA